MTVSGMDGDRRTGSLLSLAPRTAARRVAKPALNPMLAALARTPEQPAETPRVAATAEPPAAEAAVATPIADESMTASESIEPPFEQSSAEDGNSGDTPVETQQPETAKGLVARLRRQFMEGLPEGRSEAGSASTGSADPKPAAPPRRSPIEEVRFRLSEFRTEILVRAAGRAGPSRRK
jgi:hypothetical protein